MYEQEYYDNYRPQRQEHPAKSHGLAGFILSLLGLSLIGIFFSGSAMNQYKRTGYKQDGITMAGLIINVISLSSVLVMLLLFFIGFSWAVMA